MESKQLEELNMELDRLFHATGYPKNDFITARKALNSLLDDTQYDRACIGLAILWITRLRRIQEQKDA